MRCLIIDDDIYFAAAIEQSIEESLVITKTYCIEDAKKLILSHHFDIVICDMQMESDDSGIELLKFIKKRDCLKILLSSVQCDQLIEAAYREGCHHFLSKLQYRKSLPNYISKYIRTSEKNSLENVLNSKYITQDSKLISELELLSRVNLKDIHILLTGETGVGKTQIAKVIHELTIGKDKPFISINCSEISDTLIESEFFGHTKGSFTGANKNKKGLMTLANGGTLFIDEISTMSLRMQQKLLKAIDEKVFYPVGAEKPVHSQFQLITATCDDLIQMITQKEFRKDLFFRISGKNIEIKPLRERPDDIKLLIKFFCSQLERRVVIKENAFNKLCDYAWPGNIRELKKVISLLGSVQNGIIDEKDIIELISQGHSENEYLNHNQLQTIKKMGFRNFIQQIEKQVVIHALKNNNKKISYAIKETGLSTSAFYRILKDVNLA